MAGYPRHCHDFISGLKLDVMTLIIVETQGVNNFKMLTRLEQAYSTVLAAA